LVKVLDLFLWHPTLVLEPCILGFVGKHAAPLVGQLGVEMAGGVFLFFSAFLGLMGCPLQVGALKEYHEVTGL
jgi:hypothetical protein